MYDHFISSIKHQDHLIYDRCVIKFTNMYICLFCYLTLLSLMSVKLLHRLSDTRMSENMSLLHDL